MSHQWKLANPNINHSTIAETKKEIEPEVTIDAPYVLQVEATGQVQDQHEKFKHPIITREFRKMITIPYFK